MNGATKDFLVQIFQGTQLMDLLGLYPRLEWLGHKPHVCLAWIILVSGYTILQTFNMASHSKAWTVGPVSSTEEDTEFRSSESKSSAFHIHWVLNPLFPLLPLRCMDSLVVPGAILPRVFLSQRGSLETPKNNSNCGIFGFHKISIYKKGWEKGEGEDVSDRTVQTLSSP